MKLKCQDEHKYYLAEVNYSAILATLLSKALFQTELGGVMDANSFLGVSQIL